MAINSAESAPCDHNDATQVLTMQHSGSGAGFQNTHSPMCQLSCISTHSGQAYMGGLVDVLHTEVQFCQFSYSYANSHFHYGQLVEVFAIYVI